MWHGATADKRGIRMRRAIGVVALMVLPVSVATIGFASIAAAASTVTCSKLTVSLTTVIRKNIGLYRSGEHGQVGNRPDHCACGRNGKHGHDHLEQDRGTSNITVTNFSTVTPDKCKGGADGVRGTGRQSPEGQGRFLRRSKRRREARSGPSRLSSVRTSRPDKFVLLKGRRSRSGRST